ncbi:hypothetical protein VdG2_03668 [Verticillium dahliae VDG2]|nr:hypothetical protein VdG2_03668 [Verticillium dahliae VDG2]
MDLALQLRLALQAAHYPTPTTPWLPALLGPPPPPPPLPSLIIRLPTDDAADGHDLGDTATTQQPQQLPSTRPSAAAAPANATHRLVLQDCRGQNVYALELTRIERIGVGVTAIGEKMLIRSGTRVARGTLLLTPENCVVLGGKIEAWQRPWVEGRLTRLREAVGSEAGSRP